MHKYNVPEIPVEDFNRMRYLVELAFRAARPRSKLEPVVHIETVSTDMNDMPIRRNQSKMLAERYVGWAFGEMAIWLRPNRPLLDMQRTAIHEITHLRSTGDAHGPQWRKTFGIAWALWLKEQGYDWDRIRWEIYQNVRRYRRYRAWSPKGDYIPTSEYYRRLNEETDSIIKVAKKTCT